MEFDNDENSPSGKSPETQQTLKGRTAARRDNKAGGVQADIDEVPAPDVKIMHKAGTDVEAGTFRSGLIGVRNPTIRTGRTST
ncbi:hypothetical protein ACIPSA_12470 [Streptomyces sp. NPDC086549]|uniref:hypothetical protein n=1 Tax=Streptomyces sp. NPDC086549 TaxID=3365752 RepID=UPI00381EC501